MRVLNIISCKDWGHFNKKISDLGHPRDFVYRGQMDADWALESSFQRFFKASLKPFPSPHEEDPFTLLIKKYAILFGNKDKKYTDFENADFVNMGQHYGLPTPFMDWSKTINKAVFFACCDAHTYCSSCNHVAVFALKTNNIDTLTSSNSFKKYITAHNGFKLFESHGLKLEYPIKSSDNERIDAQDGLFSSLSGISNLNYDLVEFFEKEIYNIYNFEKPILYKFLIPKTECKKILMDLDSKSGINFASIYPDKEGFAKQAKLEFLFGI